jgi:hypothetical protein
VARIAGSVVPLFLQQVRTTVDKRGPAIFAAVGSWVSVSTQHVMQALN